MRVLVLAVCTLATLLAGPAAANPARREAVTDALRLSVRFADAPQLNGDYRVNADATVSIPLIGRIDVTGLAPVDLERVLSERVARIAGQPSAASVEVAEYRPVHVTGSVARVGPVPFDAGMTVLQALSLAGGPYRPPPAAGGLPGGAIRLARATEAQRRALATLARLEAEQAQADDIAIPDTLVAIAGRSGAEALIAAERPVFEARRAARTGQILALQRARDLAETELGALREQKGRINEQLTLRQDNRDTLRGLVQRGIVVADRQLEEEIKVSELEEKRANVSVALARIESTLAGLERDRVTLESNAAADLGTAVLAAQRQVADAALELRDALAEAGIRSAGPTGAAAPPALAFAVKRRGEGAGPPTPATEDTVLAPGDILVVTPAAAADPRAATAPGGEAAGGDAVGGEAAGG